MFFVLSFFYATFLNSYTASTVGDREKNGTEMELLALQFQLKMFPFGQQFFLNLILYIPIFYLTGPNIKT